MTITAFGINERGQLAGSFFGPPEGPVNCAVLPADVVQVAGAYLGYTAALCSNGIVRMLGGGVNGEMGQGGRRSSYILPVIAQVSEVQAVACAGAHILALHKDGTVSAWGGNAFGTLGNGTSGHGEEKTGTAVPIKIAGLSNVVQIATANGIAAALLADGTVKTWGSGVTGALGVGHVVALSSLEGTTPQVVPGLTGVKALAAGGFQASNHVLALLEDGTVMQWGAHGPCGVAKDLLSPTPVKGLSSIVAVEAGPGQSFAIDAVGDLWAWGVNTNGQLFLPATTTKQDAPTTVSFKTRQVSAGFQFSLALHTDGTVKGEGRNDERQLAGTSLTGIEQIYAGEHHSFATGGQPQPPPLAAVRVPGGLEVSWRSDTDHKWEVTAWPLNGAHSATVKPAPSSRSWKVASAVGQTVCVKVRGGTAWPARTVVAVA